MEVTYDISYEDYREAVGAMRRFDPSMRTMMRSIAWVLAVVPAVVFIVNIFAADDPALPPRTMTERVVGAIFVMIPWLVIVPLVIWMMRRLTRPAVSVRTEARHARRGMPRWRLG
jgi:hypothetical protein